MKVKLFIGGISAVVFMATWPILLLSQLLPFYTGAFERYQVYASFEQPEQAPDQFPQILEFIRPPFDSELDPEWYSEEDILHMQDVRNIFIALYVACVAGAIGLIATIVVFEKGKRPRLLRSVKRSWSAFVLVTLLLGLLSSVFWEELFTAFHQVLFPTNDFWLLNPESSNLIKYLPSLVFQELFALLVAIYLLQRFVVSMFRLENE